MARRFSVVVVWSCLAAILAGGIAMTYFLVDIESFAELARDDFPLAIRWDTVTTAQWYGFWAITAVKLGIGLAGLFFLRRAFMTFARGEFFDLACSRDLRRFSALLFLQALAEPLRHAVASVLLSWNHPPGQRTLSISLGSTELQILLLAMILWVISDMLVKGVAIDQENRQFV